MSRHDNATLMVQALSTLTIVLSISFSLMLLLDRGGGHAARLAVLEPEYEADSRSPDTLPELQPKELLVNQDNSTAAQASTPFPERSDDSQTREALPEANNLIASQPRPSAKSEDLGLEGERRAETLAQRPAGPDESDGKRQFDSRSEKIQEPPRESRGKTVDQRPQPPLSIVTAGDNGPEPNAAKFGGQIAAASSGRQSEKVRESKSLEAKSVPKNQGSSIPESLAPETVVSDTNDAGSFVTKQEARIALQGVGYDPVSEMIWIPAINDPYLPVNDRKNLIEDLNEDGFPDFKNITVDDLPLIVNRMAIIEDLFFESMDDANAEAFLEAYKDLNNMYTRLARESGL